MTSYRSIAGYLIPIIISMAISVMLIKQVRIIAHSHEDNTRAFYSFAVNLEDYSQTRKEFRTRILSNFLAGRLKELIKLYVEPDDPQHVMLYLPSAWTAIWYMFSSIILIFTFREKSIFYIFGLYAGISFAYLPGMGITRIYPWDLPALFGFVVLVTLIEKQKLAWLIGFVPIAILLKETIILLVIPFLFWDRKTVKQRLIYLFSTVLLAAICKGLLDVLTKNPSPIVTMTMTSSPSEFRLLENVESLLRLKSNHPIFINAGLLTSLLLLPYRTKQVISLKLIAITFTIGIFLFGLVIEYRIWFEMIPVALYGIDLELFRPDG